MDIEWVQNQIVNCNTIMSSQDYSTWFSKKKSLPLIFILSRGIFTFLFYPLLLQYSWNMLYHMVFIGKRSIQFRLLYLVHSCFPRELLPGPSPTTHMLLLLQFCCDLRTAPSVPSFIWWSADPRVSSLSCSWPSAYTASQNRRCWSCLASFHTFIVEVLTAN